jgi:thioredoxin reductase (NADPH)
MTPSSTLTSRSKSRLQELKDKREIQVFVTPTCPYCPGEVMNSFMAAIERPDLVSAECIEATENLDLARQVNLGSVPTTFVLDAQGKWEDVKGRSSEVRNFNI